MNQIASAAATQEPTAQGVRAANRRHGLDLLLGQRAGDELLRRRLDRALAGLDRLLPSGPVERTRPEAAA